MWMSLGVDARVTPTLQRLYCPRNSVANAENYRADNRVNDVVIRCCDDGDERDNRVQHAQNFGAAPFGEVEQHQATPEAPADMEARHGGELV